MAIKREKVTRTAEKLVGKGKLEAAIKEYRKILAENPNDANVLNRVGDLYARIERFDEAVKLFSQIADQYTRDGFFLKAIAIYKKIIKLAPSSLQVYERLAELYHRQGLLNEARSQFQVLADHYEKRDNATSAITIYQRMAEIDPENPAHYVKLAALFQKQQLHDKARQSYRQLADLLLVAGSVDEATRVYLEALGHYHGDLEWLGEVVRGLREEGHEEAADQVFERARQLNPEATHERLGLPAAGPPQAVEIAPPSAGDPLAAPSPEPRVSAVDGAAFEIETAGESLEDVDFASFGGEDDDDSVFTLDLESDEPAATQVLPPSDMGDGPPPGLLDSAPGEALESSETSFDFGSMDEGASPFEAAAEAAAEANEAFGAAASAEPEGDDEFDWSMEDFEDLGSADLASDAPVELDGAIELDEAIEIELEDEEFEIELELDEDDTAGGDMPATGAPPDVEPEALARREEDLLAEARVFAKYNLREKAQNRLLELLALRADHVGGLCLLARLELEAGHNEAAVERAREAATAAAATGEVEPFEELRGEFAAAGLELDDDLAVHETEAVAQKPFAQLLEDLDETSTAVPVDLEEPDEIELEPEAAAAVEVMEASAAPATDQEAEADRAPAPVHVTSSFTLGPLGDEDEEGEEEEVGEEEEGVASLEPAAQTRPFARVDSDETLAVADLEAEPAAEIEELMKSVTADSELDVADLGLDEPTDEVAVAEPAEPADDTGLVSLVDELGLDESNAAVPEAPAEAAAPDAAPDDEAGMSWLDEVAPEAEAAAPREESIFDEEDDFFDLAAELEADLADDEAEISIEAPQEQSLQEIIDGFKRGVAENLSTEDFDTHFNLGIAYREMGLLDEAIGEFQLASKDPRYIVDCSSMLGICFLEKGLPELAVRWYRKGLESPAVSEDQAMGLLYEMASAYLHLGDNDAAYRTFVEIYGMNSHYRDVAQRVQELSQEQAAS